MNSPARTLIITALITLFAARLVPAQPASETPAAGPASPRRVQAAGTAAEPSSSGTNRQPGTTTTPGRPPGAGSPVVSSTGFRRSSASGSYGYGMSSAYKATSGPASRSKRQIFIIPTAEIKQEDHLQTEWDIHVMSHMFDRVLKKPISKIGGVFTVMDDFFGRDSQVTQVIHAAGYGTMFFMEVDFALVGPPPDPEAKEPNEPKEQVDTAWEQAERELSAPLGVTNYNNLEASSEQRYDAEKVELLKRSLVETLKHATNIQALKPNESVILRVNGRAIAPTVPIRGKDNVQWIFNSGRWVHGTVDPMTTPYPMLPPTVLIIRAKKSDIDAFSKGELDFAGFYERTQFITNWSGTSGAPQEIRYGRSTRGR